MNSPCFIDTNILMYAVGSDHPLKQRCLAIVEGICAERIAAVTDTEVFQEIAYRYWRQNKWAVAQDILSKYESIFTEIFSIQRQLLSLYYSLLATYHPISPRDAIHLAVMQYNHVTRIYTADQVFAKIPFIEVLPWP
jgi:predicted nucleic acid-binding protein